MLVKIRPRQRVEEEVREPYQIDTGATYRQCYATGPSPFTFKVLRKPMDGDTHILIQEILHQKLEMSLSDLGILPYKNGYWNATNYVIRVS